VVAGVGAGELVLADTQADFGNVGPAIDRKLLILSAERSGRQAAGSNE